MSTDTSPASHSTGNEYEPNPNGTTSTPRLPLYKLELIESLAILKYLD